MFDGLMLMLIYTANGTMNILVKVIGLIKANGVLAIKILLWVNGLYVNQGADQIENHLPTYRSNTCVVKTGLLI